MRIGVDYYPEHWDKDMWKSDVRLMAETGVKIVRLAEFAWCRLEPADGVFDFVWLDEAIRLFADNGIEVIIGTPTNCPPRWLCEKYPEILPVGDNGRSRHHLSRCHAIRIECVTPEIYDFDLICKTYNINVIIPVIIFTVVFVMILKREFYPACAVREPIIVLYSRFTVKPLYSLVHRVFCCRVAAFGKLKLVTRKHFFQLVRQHFVIHFISPAIEKKIGAEILGDIILCI